MHTHWLFIFIWCSRAELHGNSANNLHVWNTISCLNSLSPVLLNMQEITGHFPLKLKAGRALVGELEGVRLELKNSPCTTLSAKTCCHRLGNYIALLLPFNLALQINVLLYGGGGLPCSDGSAVQSVVFARHLPIPSALFCCSEDLHFVWPSPVALWQSAANKNYNITCIPL